MGTLLYAVVMGFFNDYTDILDVTSFSTLFLAALVMQALTWATFRLKLRATAPFKGRTSAGSRIGMGLSVWAILFVSKFVFLEVIDILFGSSVEISGFFGLMAIILAMVVVDRFIELVDGLLADRQMVET